MSDASQHAAPERCALRYHGGKWKIAPWIIARMPKHRMYVEPFGGAASVLLRKARSQVEVYNDLDEGVVGLFRVLRDPADARELIRRLHLTPFGRAEFVGAYEPSDDPIEAARRLVVRSFMGFGSTGLFGTAAGTGFRVANASEHDYAGEWGRLPEQYGAIVDRLRGVVIENQAAIQVLQRYDGPGTLHFVDPPYVHATRSAHKKGRVYAHEMDDGEHRALIDVLKGLKGNVILCGYPSALYDDRLRDWHRESRVAHSLNAAQRTEVIWCNFSPAGQPARTRDLFAEADG